jgi:hypothetical protein
LWQEESAARGPGRFASRSFSSSSSSAPEAAEIHAGRWHSTLTFVAARCWPGLQSADLVLAESLDFPPRQLGGSPLSVSALPQGHERSLLRPWPRSEAGQQAFEKTSALGGVYLAFCPTCFSYATPHLVWEKNLKRSFSTYRGLFVQVTVVTVVTKAKRATLAAVATIARTVLLTRLARRNTGVTRLTQA